MDQMTAAELLTQRRGLRATFESQEAAALDALEQKTVAKQMMTSQQPLALLMVSVSMHLPSQPVDGGTEGWRCR